MFYHAPRLARARSGQADGGFASAGRHRVESGVCVTPNLLSLRVLLYQDQ